MLARMIPKIPMKVVARSFTSRSLLKSKDAHGHDAHHGEDHGHHDHPMFEPPFSKGLIGGALVAIVGGGTGVIMFACWWQNYKHGYYNK